MTKIDILPIYYHLFMKKNAEKSEKMKNFDENGLTLVELLASITIFSIITISLFSFFPQAYQYTTKNQSRTLEINVARGVLHYIEQQDYDLMNEIHNKVKEETGKITSFDSSSICDNKVTIADSTTMSSSETTMDLFPDRASCLSMFQPTINNKTYDAHNIQLFLLPYNWNEDDGKEMIHALERVFPSKNFETTKRKIENLREKREKEPSTSYPILSTVVYVDFSPNDKIPGVLIEGSIVSEISN